MPIQWTTLSLAEFVQDLTQNATSAQEEGFTAKGAGARWCHPRIR